MPACNLESLLKPFTADAVMNGAATLVGAFFGAMLAFLFQLILHRNQERNTAQMAAQRVLFCLLQQMNTLLLIQKDFVFPHTDDLGRFLSIPAVHEIDIDKNVFDFSTFGFMLKTNESRMIMCDLYLAQESYIEALRVLNDRSRFHREEVQSRLASSGIENGATATLGEIKIALGPLIFPTIVASTDQLIDVLKNAFNKLAKSKQDFRAYVVKRFCSNDFTDFDFPETYDLLPCTE